MKGKEMEKQVVAIRYYNVWFYLQIKNETDMIKLNYLTERIEAGEHFFMKDIYRWCLAQGINYNTKFIYRSNFSVKANVWNFYSYIRAKVEMMKMVDSL